MLKLFAARDLKADAFGSPIAVATSGLAARSFTEVCSDPKSPMAQYPGDYQLYELGTFDPMSGKIEGHNIPVFICSAVECIAEARKARLAAEPELPIGSSEVSK